MNKWEQGFSDRPVRTGLKLSTVVVLGFIGLSAVAGVGWMITAPLRAVTGVVNRTLDPDNVLYNYEWFKRQYNDLAAFDGKIRNADAALTNHRQSAGPRTTWTFEDKQEDSRLSSVLLGLQNQREAMVAEYNARAQMANRNLFRTGDLPDRI